MTKSGVVIKVWNVLLALALALSGFIALVPVSPVYTMTPPALQYFYLTLPEDQYLQFMDENFTATIAGPVRSVTSIAIGTNGTIVYYDQWEDGSYDADIANPGSNVYNATTNPDGTQIWGDGVLANGCAPNVNNTINPCASPSDDILLRGQTITLDNNVVVNGSLGSYSRNSSQIFFDGRDKVAASLPIAVTRALWPLTPGSMVADAQGVLPTERWGTTYTSPVGENIGSTGESYEDVRLVIMAGDGGANVQVDADANGVYELSFSLADGAVRFVDGILVGAKVSSNNPVQVTLLTTDVNSAWENRFYNLIPFSEWTNEYFTPVGTGTGTACTNVWVYNPNASAITVNYQIGATVQTPLSIPANSAVGSANITTGNGARFWTTGSPAPVFLPVSMTDCTNSTSGDIYDWGHELYPGKLLSPEILVGWAPGCTDASYEGVCLDAQGLTRTDSRTVLWLTPLADTTIYVDTDGSGISCAPGSVGAGAEQTIAATALRSYQVNDDPTSGTRYYVHDNFGSQSYARNDATPHTYTGVTRANWLNNWTESGDDGSASAGVIWITGGALQFRNTGGDETNISIQRGRDLAGRGYSRMSFRAQFGGAFDADDGLAVEISADGGATWTTLEILEAPMTFATGQFANKVYRTSAYNSANTTIRFRAVGNLEAGDTWSIGEVHIDDTLNGDYDMTGSYIRTCDDTLLAAAFGQSPALSFSSDDEAMDLGMGVPPYGSQLRITKDADRSFASPGDLVTYNYTVKLIQTFSTAVNNVEVEDDRCSPATYSGGDTSNPGYLDPGETWTFTCTGRMYADTTNYAMALALYGSDRIRSNPAYDTVQMTSSLGDTVWLDEDGDGDQDAGEAGIPNVKVTLTGTDMAGNAVSLTTTTDANGRYLFTDVPPSNASGYTITVDDTTLPAGLRANPTYDEDGVGTQHSTVVVLGSGVEYISADFGYNWASTAETNTPNGVSTGAIGDRVWSDADGDGVQDPGEPGLYNVPLELVTAGPDGLFGTADDVIAATTTTDYNGNYIFDGLSAGAYIVRVTTPPANTTQTGDPDSTLDHQTTAPIVLAPGDVYVNADFGYQPDAGTTAAIGDTLWVDTDRDDTIDAGEPRLAGVTVSLIRDLNGNGAWDVGEPIIATDITDSNGQYSFTGLPVTDGVGADDYLVWVNDAANVLGGLTPTYDSNGVGTPNLSVVSDLSPAGNLDQDFAYALAGHDAAEALVGDTIWFDLNNNGSYDPGEGLEGAIINLFEDTDGDGVYKFGEPFLGRTTTNENGQYFFGGLAAGTYVIDIDLATLPNYGTGLSNFVDPDGGTPHRAVVTLTDGQVRLDQDFGYRAVTGYAISGTIWNDTNADGALTEAGRFAGVTVALYTDSNDNGVWDAEDMLVGTTTTDASGNYSFANLPNDRYFVDVTDDANLLEGYWHSEGATPGADNNSQADAYTVVLADADNTTADFGYYREPASLGNYVWDDLNRDNLQTGGEPGIPGVTVLLTINWPGGGATVLSTVTDASGNYRFDNLLFDEDFNGAGLGEPSFTVTFLSPATYSPVTANVGGDDTVDSDDDSVLVSLTQGVYNDTVDSGFKQVVNIGDTLWYDWNGNGVQDAGEPGIPNIDVFIDVNNNGVYDGGDVLTVTDANGQYNFTDLPPGTYRVIVNTSDPDFPASVTQTADPDSTFDSEHTVVATTTGNYNYVDFGYQGTGSISDFIWNDLNGDGVQDAGEGGISGVTVWVDLDGDGSQDSNEPYAVTDANGQYYIGGLPANAAGYTVRVNAGAGSPVNGATATRDVDGGAVPASTPNVATVTLAAGQNRTDVDWGYQFAALSISKTSNASGVVNPGDTIQYTIIVRNNTLSQQTGIAISDPQPGGTTYVAQSTVATGFILSTSAADYLHTFENGISYSGSQGSVNWTNSWTENDNDGGGVNGGNIQVVNDSTNCPADNYCLRFENEDNGDMVYRSADLTIAACNAPAVPTLEYDYNNRLTGGSDQLRVRIYAGGGWRRTVETYTNANTGSGHVSFPLVTNEITNASYVVLQRDDDNDDNYFYIDNVRFVCTTQTYGAATLDNVKPGGTYPDLVDGVPADLVVAGDNFVLNPGQQMQVTYNVTVNNPAALFSVDNTASVVSVEQPTPQYASVSDPVYRPAVIGDRVWLDEDSDGVQDAGEPGIPNVTLVLRDGVCTPDSNCPQTVTDAEGNYLFTNVAPGSYTVAVIGGLPAGLAANRTYDEDGAGTPDASAVTVVAGEEHVTADFGYNWASTADVTNPVAGATGAIGDRVWIDADGDGVQDPGEPGLSNITMQLLTPGADGLFGTADDVVAATTTTDAAGNYIFDDLSVGVYSVRIAPAQLEPGGALEHYTQTGDPDAFGAILPADERDHQTTAPILLAPGDVYVNADFGYQPEAGYGATIGDTLWVDADRDDNVDAGEPRLPGVTVALIRDTNGNGAWDAGEPIIASTVTDVNGEYAFTGVPVTDGVGTDDYLVWVNDTANVLSELTPTYDSNGVGTPNLSAVTGLAPAGDLNQDFAYAPPGHSSGEGLIGDTIFYDRDGDSAPSAGEGLEGVTVRLYQDTNADGNYDAGEPLAAETVTNENGQYFFGNLPAGDYVVMVDVTTLPAGVTNTVSLPPFVRPQMC